MSMTFPSIIGENSVLIVKNGNRLVASKGHLNFNKIIDRIRTNNFNNIEQLFMVKDTVEKLFNVTIKNGKEIYYKKKKLHNSLTTRILRYLHDGLPYRAWICFLNRLMENPSEFCRNQLFDYVEKHGLPLDNEGFIWGYRAVNKDYMDKYSKTVNYRVGKIVTIDRKKCEQNPEVACGPSLHIGTAEYSSQWGSDNDDRFLLCRFSPKDVISCPRDSEWSKLRVCKLRVMREVKRGDVLPLNDKYMGKIIKRNKLGQFAKKK